MVNPNQSFSEKETDAPWEPFFDCISFATEDCEGDCEHCDAPKDEIEYLCETKW